MTGPRASGHGRRSRTLGALGRIAAQAAAASVTTPEAGPRAPSRGAPGPSGDRPAAAASPAPLRRVGRGRSGRRLPSPALIIIALMTLIITSIGVERITGISVLPSGLIASIRPPPRGFPVLPASRPTGIAIPAIRLDAPVQGVGIAANGTIAVPPPDRYNEAGWYDQSPTPGQYGPAVIVGHVDTRTGPAVFHELSRLRPGERVEVTREDGLVAVFEVNSIKRFDKAQLPVDQLYGDYSRPGLRLITCGGRWVGGTTGYADNVVVFASLVKRRSP
jgi:hypothetical protein